MISDQLNKLISDSDKSAKILKAGLQSLKHENDAFSAKNPNSSEARIRENLRAALTRKVIRKNLFLFFQKINYYYFLGYGSS